MSLARTSTDPADQVPLEKQDSGKPRKWRGQRGPWIDCAHEPDSWRSCKITHCNNKDINSTPHALSSTFGHPSFTKNIQRSTSSSPTTAGLRFTGFTACKAHSAAFPIHQPPPPPSYTCKAIRWTLDMALLLNLTRPKASHRGSNEVTDIWFRQP